MHLPEFTGPKNVISKHLFLLNHIDEFEKKWKAYKISYGISIRNIEVFDSSQTLQVLVSDHVAISTFLFHSVRDVFSPKVTSTSARLIGSSTRGSASGVFDEYGMVPLPKRITWVFWGGRDGCSCHLWAPPKAPQRVPVILVLGRLRCDTQDGALKNMFFSFLNKYNYTYRSWFSIWTGAIFIVTKPSSLGGKLAQNTPNKFRLRHLTQNLPRFFEDWLDKGFRKKTDKIGRIENRESRVENRESRIENGDSRLENRESRFENRESKIQNRESRIEDREYRDSRIETRESRIENRESRIENQESRIENRESRIENPESRIENRGSRISRLENRDSRVENRESRIENPESRIENRGSRISRLENRDSRVENRESRIENRESRIENRESRIENRESKIQNRESRIEDREYRDSRIETRESRIENRESKIENRKSKIQDSRIEVWTCVRMCKACTEAVHSVALWTRFGHV